MAESDPTTSSWRPSRKYDHPITLSFRDYPWSSTRDIYDFYDLRYLFDDEEILESKRQLIEDSDKYWWYTYDDDELEYNEDDNVEAAVQEQVEEPEVENWDEDEDWGVRFIYGIGFITDGYDSGYDEPYGKREEYPPWYDHIIE